MIVNAVGGLELLFGKPEGLHAFLEGMVATAAATGELLMVFQETELGPVSYSSKHD